MTHTITKFSFPFLTLIGFISCTSKVENANYLTEEIEAVKIEFAPDKRVALFDISAAKEDGVYILRGESNLPDAVVTLKNNLEAAKIDYRDSIQLLPASDLDDKNRGLVTISVANLRSAPKHSAELATQATLGTPVKILKKDDGWYLIQTPDMYLSWVDSDGIQPITQDELEGWTTKSKMIFTQLYGSSYSQPDVHSQVVSDIVAGGILEILEEESDFYKVAYPDQRIAFVNKAEAEIFESWLSHTNPTEENLVATSKRLMGLPYLWGGTSTKGVDCSGFTKTIYFLNGIVLPRDASQQIHKGELIDDAKNFEKLIPGDLLFFGKQATDSTSERVIHVGMWIGNKEFIHSAGRVKISSVDKESPHYDLYNINRYLRTKRPVGLTKGGLMNLKRTPLF